MTPTVTGAPDGADAAEPAGALEVGILPEHAAASMATAGTTAPNQRRHLSEFRVISLRPFILSSLRQHLYCSLSFSGQRVCPRWLMGREVPGTGGHGNHSFQPHC